MDRYCCETIADRQYGVFDRVLGLGWRFSGCDPTSSVDNGRPDASRAIAVCKHITDAERIVRLLNADKPERVVLDTPPLPRREEETLL